LFWTNQEENVIKKVSTIGKLSAAFVRNDFYSTFLKFIE